MANLNNLSITEVSDLRAEAQAFQDHATQLKNITDRMLDTVANTSGAWRGEAQQAYANQFAQLSDDMQRLYDKVTEYYEDLITIANNYDSIEQQNASTAASLTTDVGII